MNLLDDYKTNQSLLLTESAPSIIYHAIYTQSLMPILEHDYYPLESNLGTDSDQIGSSKFYFLSCATVKYGGYMRGMRLERTSVIVLNGDRLNYKYKAVPVDYWGPFWKQNTGDHKEWEDRMMSKDENEIRIVTDEPDILHFNQYIKEIHTYIGEAEVGKEFEMFYDHPDRNIERICKAKEIPIYIYSSKSAFLTQFKKKAFHHFDPDEKSSGSEVGKLAKIATLNNVEEIRKLPASYDDVVQGISKDWYQNDFVRRIEADIHIARSNSNLHWQVAEITKQMKRYKVRTIRDFVKALQMKFFPDY